jgi:hypothetical protein
MSERGRTLPLSLPRRWVGDMLHFAQRVPLVAAERTLRVRALAEARRAAPHPPTWNSLMIKGMGLVSAAMPELRRAYLPYPLPRLYEAPYSVANVVFERDFDGTPATFMCPLPHPERMKLQHIADKVTRWKEDPVSAHGVLRRLVRNSKPPRPVRRLLWAAGLYWHGLMRARMFGTFAVNTVASLRGRMLTLQSPLTFICYYGSVDKKGEMLIQMGFDHRVFDGSTAGYAASKLEGVLNNELVAEVKAG